MAKKRFTDIKIWKKLWYQEAKPEHKLFWNYIKDDCDHAGIWEVNFNDANHYIGIEINKEEVMELLKNKIIELENGEKWFIVKFVEFQYSNPLNPKVKAHKSVIDILSKYGLVNDDYSLNTDKLLTVRQGLDNSCLTLKDKDRDKDKDMDKDSKVRLVLSSEPKETAYFDGTFNKLKLNEELRPAWYKWVDFNEERGDSLTKTTVELQLEYLAKLTVAEAKEKIRISIARKYKGLEYEGNGAFKRQPAKGTTSIEEIRDGINKAYQ